MQIRFKYFAFKSHRGAYQKIYGAKALGIVSFKFHRKYLYLENNNKHAKKLK